MLTDKEKDLIEKYIDFHKKAGGTVTPDNKPRFILSLGEGFFDINPIISKCIALDLIKYKLSDRTGWTSLTKKGWDFTTFKNFEKMVLNQQEIDKITIDKLKIDLLNAKRKGRMFWPMTILTIILGVFSLINQTNTVLRQDSLEQIRTRLNTTDSVLYRLTEKLQEFRSDTSKSVSKTQILDK